MRFLVIGAGKQGSACALDLVQQSVTQAVVVADKVIDHLPKFLDPFKGGGKLELLKLDLADHGAVRSAMRRADCVLSAAPYYFNYDLAKLALDAGIHFADLGGNTEIVLNQKKLHEEAAKQRVKIIPDCGVAPGMVNVLAGEGIR